MACNNFTCYSYLFIVLAGVIRIDYDMISPGGLNEVGNVISVDEGYQQNGSFNTVSVYSVERIPLLTYLIGKIDNIVSIEETSELIQMTDSESVSSGTIQKNVSINNAIILAYKTAKKQGKAYCLGYSFGKYNIPAR